MRNRRSCKCSHTNEKEALQSNWNRYKVFKLASEWSYRSDVLVVTCEESTSGYQQYINTVTWGLRLLNSYLNYNMNRNVGMKQFGVYREATFSQMTSSSAVLDIFVNNAKRSVFYSSHVSLYTCFCVMLLSSKPYLEHVDRSSFVRVSNAVQLTGESWSTAVSQGAQPRVNLNKMQPTSWRITKSM